MFITAACGTDAPAPCAVASFDIDADWSKAERFFDFPWPSDLRLTSTGTPDLTGFPDPRASKLLAGLRKVASERSGWPIVPVAYFRFSRAIAAREPHAPIAAELSAPVWLIDIDEKSPERGRLFQLVAATPPADDYVPEHVLAIAPRPGVLLAPKRRYAFVVTRELGDATGQSLDAPPALADLAAGRTPAGTRGAAATSLYAPLWATLKTKNIDTSRVAAATVFTTGDVVADTAALSDALLAKYKAEVSNLHLDPDDGAKHERYCELIGTVKQPQFQRGVPPFNVDGLFDFSDNGLPAKQRDEEMPVVITIPKAPMPAGGYPLAMYFHGSGGLSASVVDRGPVLMAGGDFTKGLGPAHVLAGRGIAAAGAALPANPERIKDAPELAYINFNNLAAFRDTFRQGVIEQRLLLSALRTIKIDPALLQGCAGPSLPSGETAYRFDENKVVAQGQSMGGMYTNMISAVEPRIRAAVPTGAGGYWSYMVLETSLIMNAGSLLSAILGTETLTFLHPTMHLLELGWETADPIVYMPRLSKRPLPGHPARPVYEPVGQGDSYFPTTVYDAMALAYGHQQAGEVVWPTMQQSLKIDNLDGIQSYPVSQNRTSENGDKYTGVVVQYRGDGFFDPHAIYTQLPAVKYQYGCFFESFLATGKATVPAPAPDGTPCPK